MFGDKLLNIAYLAESQDSIGPISRNGHTEVVATFAQISHFKTFIKLIFNTLDLLLIRSSEKDIVHINGNNSGAVTKD